MTYDEDRELTRYVWDHYSPLMTEFERRVGRAIMGRMKAAGSEQSPQLAGMLNRRWGAIDDAEINEALVDGPEAFRRNVRDRVLAECGAELFVNRCPGCRNIARTPRARQCFWCGHDWHGGGS